MKLIATMSIILSLFSFSPAWCAQTATSSALLPIHHSSTIKSLHVSHNTKTIATLSDKIRIHTCLNNTWQPQPCFELDATGVSDIAFSKDADTLAIARRKQGIIDVWQPDAGNRWNTQLGVNAVLRMPETRVDKIVLSDDGDTMIASHHDERDAYVGIWKAGPYKIWQTNPDVSLVLRKSLINCLGLSRNKKVIAAGTFGAGNNVYVWSESDCHQWQKDPDGFILNPKKDLPEGASYGSLPFSMQVSPTGNMIVATSSVIHSITPLKSEDGKHNWSLRPLEIVEHEGNSSGLWPMVMSAEGGMLVYATGKNAIKLIKFGPNQQLCNRHVSIPNLDVIRALSLCSDNRLLVAGDNLGKIAVVPIEDNK